VSGWNHRICERCWFDRCWPEVRLAVRVLDAKPAHCCFCSCISYSGIHVRESPAFAKLACRGVLGAEHGNPSDVERALLNAIESLTPPAVHILDAGVPLCGFSDKVPGEWPAGHKWVRRDEAGATCPRCRAEAGLSD